MHQETYSSQLGYATPSNAYLRYTKQAIKSTPHFNYIGEILDGENFQYPTSIQQTLKE